MPPENDRSRPAEAAPIQSEGRDSSASHREWRLITRNPLTRRPLIRCDECWRTLPNELNSLRRLLWQETVDVPRHYRCGACAVSP
jgi:hypothetical protein